MGKATIVSGGADGLYQVKLDYGKKTRDDAVVRIIARMGELVAAIATAQTKLDEQQALEDASKDLVTAAIDAYVAATQAVPVAAQAITAAQQALATLSADPTATPAQIAAAEAQVTAAKAAYTAAQNAIKPALDAYTKAALALVAEKRTTAGLALTLEILQIEQAKLEKDLGYWQRLVLEQTLPAWCADLTEDATGTVATIEIPGENKLLLIAPAAPAHVPATDGNLSAREVQTPEQVFFNAAILPGWQKYKPTYRRGTITAINEAADTADVTLEATDTSSAQNLGINQTPTLAGVPVQYMECHSAAFKVGDACVIKFTGQDWAAPKVVGFVDNPRSCGLGLNIWREGIFQPAIAAVIVGADVVTRVVKTTTQGPHPFFAVEPSVWYYGTVWPKVLKMTLLSPDGKRAAQIQNGAVTFLKLNPADPAAPLTLATLSVLGQANFSAQPKVSIGVISESTASSGDMTPVVLSAHISIDPANPDMSPVAVERVLAWVNAGGVLERRFFRGTIENMNNTRLTVQSVVGTHDSVYALVAAENYVASTDTEFNRSYTLSSTLSLHSYTPAGDSVVQLATAGPGLIHPVAGTPTDYSFNGAIILTDKGAVDVLVYKTQYSHVSGETRIASMSLHRKVGAWYVPTELLRRTENNLWSLPLEFSIGPGMDRIWFPRQGVTAGRVTYFIGGHLMLRYPEELAADGAVVVAERFAGRQQLLPGTLEIAIYDSFQIRGKNILSNDVVTGTQRALAVIEVSPKYADAAATTVQYTNPVKFPVDKTGAATGRGAAPALPP